MNDNVDRPGIVQFVFDISGALGVADDQYYWVPVPVNCHLNGGHATVKTAPVGAAITIEIEYKRGVAAWATAVASANFDIAAAANIGTVGTITVAALEAGDMLRINIDQVGGGPAGSDLQCMLYAGI